MKRVGSQIWPALGLVVLMACSSPSPLAVAESYAQAVYARDYDSAYDYISASDQAVVSKEAYVNQHESFEGIPLDITRRLAKLIEFRDGQLTQVDDTATVTVHVRAPDGNAPAIAEILEQAGQHGSDAAALQSRVDELLRSGQLPFIEGDQTFDLQRASGGWGVNLRLGEAALLKFTAGVKDGLPWEFAPLQQSARLSIDDTVRVQYRVRNHSDRTITGKADEDTFPEAQAGHLYFYQCFCMFQLTLDPGEEQTLTVVIALREPLPAGQNELEVHYDFYPIESFPADEREDLLWPVP